jgi:hypothetical protein
MDSKMKEPGNKGKGRKVVPTNRLLTELNEVEAGQVNRK